MTSLSWGLVGAACMLGGFAVFAIATAYRMSEVRSRRVADAFSKATGTINCPGCHVVLPSESVRMHTAGTQTRYWYCATCGIQISHNPRRRPE